MTNVHTVAIKRVIAWRLAEALKVKHIIKSEMAKRANTSRSQLNRLLDPQIQASSFRCSPVPRRPSGRNCELN